MTHLKRLAQHEIQETHQEMRIPERDVTYIVLSVYLHNAIPLFHRYPLNRKQSY